MKTIYQNLNMYHLVDNKYTDSVIYIAIASDEAHVIELAKENNINISELTIELVRTNVKYQYNSVEPDIHECLVN